MAKHWIAQAIALLQSSRDPVTHEINKLDWKLSLSDNKERLIEHLYPQGGYLIYGISDAGAVLAGVDQEQVQDVISQLTNLGRDAVEPPLLLDHAVTTVIFGICPVSGLRCSPS